jgi:signal transduction histidine kinase
MRVLAVDDDAVARLAVQAMVRALGHECLLARDGFQAWDCLQAEPFDVVITDRVMPDLDGLELCRKIRANSSDAGYVYVVLASALGEDDQARDGMLAGADDYLVKPLRRGKLELKLIAAERVTTLHRRLAQLNDELHKTIVRDTESNQRLSSANQLQADMIAILSHDARQPLTAVIGFTESTLDDWKTSPDEVKIAGVTKALDAARHLDQLIEDVLTMTNLESGTIACRPEKTVVAKIIREAITAAAGTTPIELTGDLSACGMVDPWHLRQILTNLIGNAAKYGTAPITVAVESTGQGLDIRVSDSGEGVPAQFIPHLFDRFTRADTGIATRKKGTGLGLYIVRRLVEANHGQIAYQPGTAVGASFTVTLPVEALVHRAG